MQAKAGRRVIGRRSETWGHGARKNERRDPSATKIIRCPGPRAKSGGTAAIQLTESKDNCYFLRDLLFSQTTTLLFSQTTTLTGIEIFDGAEVSLGAVPVPVWGAGKSLTFTIRNSGGADLTGLAITTSGINADSDRDGIRNLVEYATGGDPIVADLSRAPKPGFANFGGNRYLTLSFHRLKGAAGLLSQVQESANPWFANV